MTVLGFHGGSHCRPGYADKLRAAGAAVIFDDMRQLPDLIGRSGDKRLGLVIPGRCVTPNPESDSGLVLDRPE